MGLFDSISSALSGVGQSIEDSPVYKGVSNFVSQIPQAAASDLSQGTQAVGSFLQQHAVQPLANDASSDWQDTKSFLNDNFSPSGNGLVGSSLDYLNNRIQNNDLVPTASDIGQTLFPNASASLSSYESQHPVANFAGSIAQGFLNFPSDIANQGVVAPTADVSHEASNYLGGGTGLSYSQLLSSPARVGYDISQGSTPQRLIGDVAGTASPILQAYALGGAGKLFEQGASTILGDGEGLLPTMGRGFLSQGGIGVAQGVTSGLEQGKEGSLSDQFLGAAEQGLLSGLVSGVVGGAAPLAGAGLEAALGRLRLSSAADLVGREVPSRPTEKWLSAQQPDQPYTIHQYGEYKSETIPNQMMPAYIKNGYKMPEVPASSYADIPAGTAGESRVTFGEDGTPISIKSDNPKFEDWLQGQKINMPNTKAPAYIKPGAFAAPFMDEGSTGQGNYDNAPNFDRQFTQEQNSTIRDLLGSEYIKDAKKVVNSKDYQNGHIDHSSIPDYSEVLDLLRNNAPHLTSGKSDADIMEMVANTPIKRAKAPASSGKVTFDTPQEQPAPETQGPKLVDRSQPQGSVQDPQAAAMAANHPDVPLSAPPENTGTGSGKVEDKYITSLRDSPDISPQVKELLGSEHDVRSNDELSQTSQARIDQNPETAHSFALSSITDEGVRTGQLLIDKYQQAGNFKAAADLANQSARNLVEAGRTVQAASLINRLSPEGIVQFAAREVERANVGRPEGKQLQLTPEKAQELYQKAAAARELPEGKARNAAEQKLMESVKAIVPSSWIDKAISLYKTNLLTGLKTIGRITVSHPVQAAAEMASKVPASMIDKAISMVNDRRSLTATVYGYPKGFYDGLKSAGEYVAHGIQDPNFSPHTDFKSGANFGDSFGGKVAQAYTGLISRIHGSVYQPFYGGAHLNSLFDQGLTEAANQGLKGPAKEEFVTNYVKDPPAQALENAKTDASKATLQQKSALNQIIAPKPTDSATVKVTKALLAPFSRISSAIANSVITYGPVGGVKALLDAAVKGSQGEFTQQAQRMMVQDLGRATIGSSLLAGGAALFAAGHIHLNAPTDPKERELWTQKGWQPDSIDFNGRNYSLATLGPVGHILTVGGYIKQGYDQGGLQGAVSQGMLGTLRTLTDASYLKGASGLLKAVNDPAHFAQTAVNSAVSGVVPTLFGNAASSTDPYQRQTNTVADAITNKIPGLRENNLTQIGLDGKPVPRSGAPLESFANPFSPSTDRSNPVTDEMHRLYSAGLPAAVPSKQGSSQTFNGVRFNLTPAQLTSLQQKVGSAQQAVLSKVIAAPGYQNLTDEQKATAIQQVVAASDKQARGQALQAEIQKEAAQVSPQAVARMSDAERVALVQQSPELRPLVATVMKSLKDGTPLPKAAGGKGFQLFSPTPGAAAAGLSGTMPTSSSAPAGLGAFVPRNPTSLSAMPVFSGGSRGVSGAVKFGTSSGLKLPSVLQSSSSSTKGVSNGTLKGIAAPKMPGGMNLPPKGFSTVGLKGVPKADIAKILAAGRVPAGLMHKTGGKITMPAIVAQTKRKYTGSKTRFLKIGHGAPSPFENQVAHQNFSFLKNEL